ncbi:MAG: glycosyltransferase, partial [Holosporales bacterium]|nr:glycosyltransferase [Holosporales bacterium]
PTEKCVEIYQRETGRTNYLFVTNGFDEELFFSKENVERKNRPPVVGFMGSFPFRRGGKEVVTAVHLLKERYPDISGIVIGDNGEADKVRDYARSLGILDRIDIPGERPYSEMPQYARRMTVGVSLWEDMKYAENYRASNQKIRQYLACGVPVLSICDSFIEENALGARLKSYSPEDLITAVEQCIELSRDPKTAERCAQFARKHFSNRMLTERRLQFWQRILDEQATRNLSEN